MIERFKLGKLFREREENDSNKNKYTQYIL